eukprot:g19699.t1
MSTPAVSETTRTATIIKPPRKDVLVSSTAEKPRFRRLPRGGSAPSSTAAAAASAATAAAAARENFSPPIDQSEQRKPKRGSDRGDSSSGVVGRNAGADFPSPLTKPSLFGTATAAAATAATFATPAAAAAATAATAAAAAAAAAAVAGATPAAVGIDAESAAAAAGEKKSGSASFSSAPTSLVFEDDSRSFDKASASVTFIHFDQQGRPSPDDRNFATGGGETSTFSSSSSCSSSSAGGMGMGVRLDKWKAPPTSASGIFSVGASSSQAAAAAVGRRRRRVGG